MTYRILTSFLLVLAISATSVFAQSRPGTPDGILTQDWQLPAHPQLEFAASSSAADQKNQIADRHRKAGAASGKEGCNLQCPTE